MSSAQLFDIAPDEWALLRRLLDEAIELPAAERTAWLANLPPEHAHLRERLERLLAHADDSLDNDATETSATRRQDTQRFGSLPRLAPLDEAAPALPPDTGPYRAIRLLGEGGMGRVWLAERTDMLHGRPVALKIPQAAWRHPQLAERMAQEREILAVLDHPNIARIYDAGVAADGQPWLALEYVEGERIDIHATRLGLGPRERIALFLQVIAAVAHAHARLVVHRDLKPGNILVTPDGQVRLLDFGIAKLLGPSDAAAELTAPAQRALTPQYAAPEQILGQPIGTAADIYSLGVVLYEFLTGELPYKPRRASAAALEETIVNTAPPRPSQRSADPIVRRTLTGDLDTVLLKALKKDPAERYPTAQAFADDLQRWLDNRPVSAQPDSAVYQLRKFVQRNRLGVGLAAGFVFSLGAALGVALWQANEAKQQAAKAVAITDFLVGLFKANDIEQAEGLSKRQQSVQQLLEHSADALGTGLTDQPEVRTELQRVVGGLLNDLELNVAAVRLRQQRATALQTARAPLSEQVVALRELGTSQRADNQLNESRATLVQAEALCRSTSHPPQPLCLGIEVDLGRLDFIETKWDAALKQVMPALPQLEALAPGTDDLAAAYELLASLHAARNQADEALERFRQALRLRETMWGEDSVRLAQSRYRFGRTLWALRRPAMAEVELQAALQTTVQALGANHMLSARIESNLGRLQFYIGLSSDGLQRLSHALQTLRSQGDRIETFELYQVQMYWSNALLVDGHLEEAREAIDEALAMRDQLQGKTGPDVTLDVTQARWLIDTGHFSEGRTILEHLRDQAIERSGASHPDVADRRFRVAQAWLSSGDLAKAEAELKAAMETQDSEEVAFGSPKHRAQLVLIALWIAQGRYEEATPLAESLDRGSRKTPRNEQFREPLVHLHTAIARTWAGVGRRQEADSHFRQAIDLLRTTNPHHHWLSELYAYQAQNLAAQNDGVHACAQLALAEMVLREQQLAGPQFHRTVRQVRRQMSCPSAKSMTTATDPKATVSGDESALRSL